MTEFYPEQPSINLSNSSNLIANSTMPSFYPPSAKHRTVLTKQLTDRDDDDHDHDSIYKEAFIIQIFQHWKIKTLEHQHAMVNSTNHLTSTDQKSETKLDTQHTAPQIPINENKTDENVSTVQPAMRKRVTPLHRKDPLKKAISSPVESSNPNLLAPDAKTKIRPNVQKKAPKPGPIFIAPKKTQPSGIPRGYSFYGCDDVNSVKRRTPIDDEQHHHINRSFLLPMSCAIDNDDDDGTSSDENNHESLFLRNRSAMKKPVVSKQKYILPSHVIIPTAILVTDPYGHSHSYDVDHEHINGSKSNEENFSDDNNNLEKYTLHSIGEEDEEINEKNNRNRSILSKELDRIEAFTRSRQTNTETDKNEQPEKKPLGRRWSEGGVSDEDEPSPSPSLVKMASTASVVKQNNPQPTKMSKTKYLLMKLHLTSPNKDDESNNNNHNTLLPPQRKRVVRRAPDKKRYQTH